MTDLLSALYLWTKAFHLMSVISWMAGLFYLPRLFVYQAEKGSKATEPALTLQVMEEKLLRVIMTPAMAATWLFGLLLAMTPGVIDWSSGWVWIKLLCVLAMTIFHMFLARWRRELREGTSTRTGRFFRLANEVPTVLMLIIVIMVVAKPL